MALNDKIELCNDGGCRKLKKHTGSHSRTPTDVWSFLEKKDKNKLVKASFATPRGGSKGAYQNHVSRSNKVIIPYERYNEVDLKNYKNGFVVRLFPEQYFSEVSSIKPEFNDPNFPIKLGENAFILYRTHNSLKKFPPIKGWTIRRLIKDSKEITKRAAGVSDIGHYVYRLSTKGKDQKNDDGPPQGIFAPEYADDDTNYLAQVVLAWLIVNTAKSPYTASQAKHIEAILKTEGLFKNNHFENNGIIRNGYSICPLCLKFFYYNELHATVSFDDTVGLENAGVQVEDSTRSTIVNLFHINPLNYQTLEHLPSTVAWGHAICNTRLGQRKCYSINAIQNMDKKVGIIKPDGIFTFGWISDDYKMIRSPRGAVWILLNEDVNTNEWEAPIME